MIASSYRSKRSGLVRCYICDEPGHIAKSCVRRQRQEWSGENWSETSALPDSLPWAWDRNRGGTPDNESAGTEYGTPLQSDPEDGGRVSPLLGIGRIRAMELNTSEEEIIGFSELFDGETKETLNGRGSGIASAGTIRC
jgi:hypothetical protein